MFASELDGTNKKVIDEFKYFQDLFDAKLHLVWVETPNTAVNDDLGLERLETIARDHQLSNYKVHIAKAFKPEDGILAFGRQIKADMIAMSTHSRKGLMHLLVGSVAEDVVNHAKIPVWTYSVK